MKPKLNDLFRTAGEIPRSTFFIWAWLLFAIKFNLDRLVVRLALDREWSVFSYFGEPFPGFSEISPTRTPKELLLLLAVSIPFLWVGIVLSVKRLRSAKLPLWLAVLFVVPILKLFLFLALAIIPARAAGEERKKEAPSWLPKSAFGSALAAVVATVLLAALAAAIGAQTMGQYGWALFAGIPFSMGFLSTLIFGARERRTLGESVSVAITSVTLTGGLFLAMAFEGVICILMAAPIALVLSILGAVAGHVVLSGSRYGAGTQMYCLPVMALPLMLGVESLREGPPPLLRVASVVEINAPVEKVWKNVVEFSELPPPREFIFRLGIAYPIRAEIVGRGPGAVRKCVFSTGPFVEPIQVWDEPRLLQFTVTSNPQPMQEWTPYPEIHPRHLNGFLLSERGQFLLKPLPGNRTLLEGTTWYKHSMWPAAYWQVWSDQIIHAIHGRVLNHIKSQSETEIAARPVAAL